VICWSTSKAEGAGMSLEQEVAAHYGRDDRAGAILAALEAEGMDPDRLGVDDLAPVDEFHVRGRQATVELGGKLGLEPGMQVLDVGCGIGGASRYLAATYGCRITGIDLTPSYCELATRFARSTGLADRLDYRQGSALAMPFADAAFDAAYTQHVAMNIAAKDALYREIARVLKQGAVFGIYDILRGPGGEVLYPVPWASEASASFLATPDEMRELLAAAGFVILGWRDTTAEGRAFVEALLARIAESGPPPLGLHLLLPDFRPRALNVLQSMGEDRIAVVEIVCRRG
jgi:SAM-dependent methyltransferase